MVESPYNTQAFAGRKLSKKPKCFGRNTFIALIIKEILKNLNQT